MTAPCPFCGLPRDRILDERETALPSANDAAAGQTVLHLHIHLIPRYAGDRLLARAVLNDFDRHHPDDPSALRAQRLAQELAR